MTQSRICYYNQNITSPDQTTANLKLLLNLISVAMYSTNANGTILANKHISFLKFRNIIDNLYVIKADVSTYTIDSHFAKQVTDLNSDNILPLAKDIVLNLIQKNSEKLNAFANIQMKSVLRFSNRTKITDLSDRQTVLSDLISEQDSLIRALKWLNKTTGTNNTSEIINRLNIFTKLPDILDNIATETHWFDNSNNTLSDFKDRFKIELSTPDNIKPDKEGYLGCQSVLEISIYNPKRDRWQVIYQKWMNELLRDYNINSVNSLKYSIVSDFKFRIGCEHDTTDKIEQDIMQKIENYINQLKF